MMNRFNLGFYLHLKALSTSNMVNGSSTTLAWHTRTNLISKFELLFTIFLVLKVCALINAYVEKSINLIFLSYKVIISFEKTLIKLLDWYGFLLQCFYELFIVSKFWMNGLSLEGQKSRVSLKISSFPSSKPYGFGTAWGGTGFGMTWCFWVNCSSTPVFLSFSDKCHLALYFSVFLPLLSSQH